MDTETDDGDAVDPRSYSDASPMVRLFGHPGAVALTEEMFETETMPAVDIAAKAGVDGKDGREFLDILVAIGAAHEDDGQYGFIRWGDVGAELIHSHGQLAHAGLDLFEVLGDETLLRVTDAFLRKHYHGSTVGMLADITDCDPADVREAVETLDGAGLLETPDEHPAESDAFEDGAADIDEAAYVIDTEDDAAKALGRLQNELLYAGDRIPPA